ncbi:hypothetical protein POKO110462_10115 [Pontibacter korlensis]|uniref:DUF748 domain-containing protein n=1 Tax=Pontibacter korlensis TaxID=400092 RepID=A0A0E3ZIQ4_9BACT|nr:hypothetical protein [Pontibacter korlensis]AKD04789.1 hypothetical protein PKOR_18925 [Pontibacter korlensis]
MYQYTKNNAKKTNKWLKVTAWVVGIALVLFLGLFIFTFWLEGKIERMVADQSKGVYKLQVFGLSTSPFVGSLSVDSLSLKPDYDRWNELSSQGSNVSRTLVEFQTGSVAIRKLSYFKVLFNNSVQLDEIVVQQPKLLMTVMRQDTTESHVPMHQTAKGFLKGLSIGKISVSRARLRYRSKVEAGTDTVFALKQFNLGVTDFILDSTSFNDPTRAYYAKKYEFTAQGARYILSDGLHEATSDSIAVSTASGTVVASGIKFTPLVDQAALSKVKGKAATHQKVEVKKVSISGVAFAEHSRTNSLKAKHLLLQTPSLIAFKNKKDFQDEENKPTPHEIVQGIKPRFLLDTLEIQNGYIRYEELAPAATERGHITFHKVSSTIANVSNIPEHMTNENPAVVKVSTMVMDRAKVEVTIRIPLLNKDGYHTLSGTVGGANLQVLNPILVPTAFVKIASGVVSSGKFNAELNNTSANGSMMLLYNNLKIELLNKGSGGQQGLGKEVLSFLANKVAIKSSNPSEGEQPRTGNITVTRDPQKSIFNYWKSCLVSGGLSSMGLNNMAKQ